MTLYIGREELIALARSYPGASSAGVVIHGLLALIDAPRRRDSLERIADALEAMLPRTPERRIRR